MRFILLAIVAFSANSFAQDLDYDYDFNARIEYDTGYFNVADEDYKESGLRRARLSHKGSFYDKTIFYETEIDLSELDEEDEVEFKDNYIGYKNTSDYLSLDYRYKLGNVKVPFSLDSYAGSKNSTFMESPLTDTMTQTRKLGIEGLVSKKIDDHRVNLFLGTFKNSIDENRDDEIEKSRHAIKTTYSYEFDDNHLLHLGGSFIYSDINLDSITYKQESESYFIKDKYVSTKVKNVNSSKDISLEALYINNSFHMQAEYIQSRIDAQSDDYVFDGYYAQVGYFLFGGSKSFKRGSSKFSSKNIENGDVELGLRYSYINLNDKDEEGGTQKDYSLALNWYLNKNLKLMTNYVRAYPSSEDYDGVLNLVQARVVVTF